MSARKRGVGYPRDPSVALGHWRQAAELRAGWLRHGLSCSPAERQAAQSAITELYALAGAPPPRFVWATSPAAAVELLAGRAEAFIDISSSRWEDTAFLPIAIRLAGLQGELRHRLEKATNSSLDPRWSWSGSSAQARDQPEEALRSGVRLSEVLDVGVLDPLRLSLRDGVAVPLRAALPKAVNLITWHGQHDAHWLAHFDIRLRLGLGRIGPQDAAQLALWATLVRSCGWWWPYDDVCVITERTSAVSMEPVPASRHGEVRPHSAAGPALLYPDGWGIHAWHGTPVPAWVIEDPTVDRIQAERNIEVRRCAIERIGWAAYVRQAGMSLVSVAADPGNPGCKLELYDLPPDMWGPPGRVLLAVNGSVERDGHRRRYGLNVPAEIDDPIAAAGWSYGLSGEQYARLQRRT